MYYIQSTRGFIPDVTRRYEENLLVLRPAGKDGDGQPFYSVSASRAAGSAYAPGARLRPAQLAAGVTDSLFFGRTGLLLAQLPLASAPASPEDRERFVRRAERTRDAFPCIPDVSSPTGDRILAIAEYCGCGADIAGGDVSVLALADADEGFFRAAAFVLSLAFRRIAKLRGFNFHSELSGGTPVFTFTATVAPEFLRRRERKSAYVFPGYAVFEPFSGTVPRPSPRTQPGLTLPEDVPEFFVLSSVARRCAVPLLFDVRRLSDGTHAAVRFCPIPKPADGLRAPSLRPEADLSALPIDYSGRF